ncbi:HAD-IC family P-type ATPase [Synechococcus sp. CBW1107]|uniref:HAD-IC family P-type ATPase n=1 Tax=Synechococcus sp. CBW1107 TaxID=2789857 RepID=UPI002AD56DF5|nr:HAD-IC family P-type ATPase [Synechococcus sp. CBW1107]CAK6689084.1 putative cation-transporting ATPase F [Synechococcus sp. CBW1107]
MSGPTTRLWDENHQDLPFHALEGAALVTRLGSDPERGLSDEEAARRLSRFGPNQLTALPGRPGWLRFLDQFHNPLLYTLLVTGLIKLWIDSLGEALVIWSVTLINAVIGFVQEDRAESSIAALAQSVRTQVDAVRGGRELRLPSEQLVIGDLVRLSAGARVPADLRLLQVRELRLDESALTGESLPVSKSAQAAPVDAALGDRLGMAHAGSFVTAGQATGLVVACAGASEVGQISTVLRQRQSLSTPLTRKFQRFSQTLLKLILVLAALTFAVGLIRQRSSAEMFDGAVALAVGAIPEELPAIVTVTLAIGVKRMARRNAIIRKLPAVEALGSTTVICSDKTGTLTQNRMLVREIYAAGDLCTLESLWDQDSLVANRAMGETLLAGLLCNDARHSEEGGLVGDPTETALLVAARSAGLDHERSLIEHPRRDAIPFESERQYMATLHGSARILVKGSVEAVLPRCLSQLNAAGSDEPLDDEAIHEAVASMAGRGQRVLAFAVGLAQPQQPSLKEHHVARGLQFVGLQGMLDPPRPEVIAAVAACRAAGIRVKMITGDHLETALAIAGQIGLGSGDGPLEGLDGPALTRLAPDSLASSVERLDVFARVAPAQKLELVRALQANGEIVAMTGDGVNDAPALKQADIGIAMGRGGTEVAREAADMLLTDDNFATIEAAVEEGRAVYLNLRKSLAFVLPVNGAASMTILLAALLGLELPVTALQVLWLNMVSSLTMSVPLAFEPRCEGLMLQPPRPPRQPLLTGGLIQRILLVSMFNWALIFSLFAWGRHDGLDLAGARTMAVQGLVLAQMVYLLSISQVSKGLHRLGERGWGQLTQAPVLLLGLALALMLQVTFSQLAWMNQLFGTEALSLKQWLICALPMLPMLPVALAGQRLDPTTDPAGHELVPVERRA